MNITLYPCQACFHRDRPLRPTSNHWEWFQRTQYLIDHSCPLSKISFSFYETIILNVQKKLATLQLLFFRVNCLKRTMNSKKPLIIGYCLKYCVSSECDLTRMKVKLLLTEALRHRALYILFSIVYRCSDILSCKHIINTFCECQQSVNESGFHANPLPFILNILFVPRKCL